MAGGVTGDEEVSSHGGGLEFERRERKAFVSSVYVVESSAYRGTTHCVLFRE